MVIVVAACRCRDQGTGRPPGRAARIVDPPERLENLRMSTPGHLEHDGSHPAVRVTVPEDVRQGVYANLALISHSGHEFSVDLCQVQHGGDGDEVRADVVSRVHLPPTIVRSLISTLQANLDAYEGRFGAVRQVEPGA
jgi:hypothetical protein